MKIANNDIRTRAKKAGVRLWQIAEKLGINDGNFSRKLRIELPEKEKERIFNIIEELEKEQPAEPKMTNYEKIKSLSIDEMAKSFLHIDNNAIDMTSIVCRELPDCQIALDNMEIIPQSKCIECFKHWLNSECEVQK